MNEPGLIIQNDTDLHYRIMKLNNLKEEQEQAIKRNVRELVYSLHPSMMVKNLFNKLASEPEVGGTLKSAALNLGKDFLISRLFGKGGSIKGFITSLLVKKATDFVTEKYPDAISNGIQKVQGYVRDGFNKAEDFVKDLKAKTAH